MLPPRIGGGRHTPLVAQKFRSDKSPGTAGPFHFDQRHNSIQSPETGFYEGATSREPHICAGAARPVSNILDWLAMERRFSRFAWPYFPRGPRVARQIRWNITAPSSGSLAPAPMWTRPAPVFRWARPPTLDVQTTARGVVVRAAFCFFPPAQILPPFSQPVARIPSGSSFSDAGRISIARPRAIVFEYEPGKQTITRKISRAWNCAFKLQCISITAHFSPASTNHWEFADFFRVK